MATNNWFQPITDGIGALAGLGILRNKGVQGTGPQKPVHELELSSASEHAVDVIREINAFSENVLERLGGQFERLAQLEALCKAINSSDAEDSRALTVEELTAAIADQRDLFEYLQLACRTIQRDSQCIESYVTDALVDPLTKAANRRAFDYELRRRFSEWNRERTPISLIMVDIDHFKQVNDVHGHPAGDELLRSFAELLRKSIRETDQVARYGGEEFGIILPNTNISSAKQVGRAICHRIENETFPVGKEAISLTASAGIATAVVGDDERTLIHRADLALYAAKRSGRNCVFAHTGLDCECVANGTAREGTASQLTRGPRDTITELHDAAIFREYLEYRIAEFVRYGTSFSIMSVRIDGFDELQNASVRRAEVALRNVARFITAALRSADFVSRLEKDHFAAVLPATALEEVLYPAERLRRSVAACDRLHVDGEPLRLTVSIGAAEASEQVSAESLLSSVFEASKAAHDAGGNCIYGQDQGMCLELDALSLLPELMDV